MQKPVIMHPLMQIAAVGAVLGDPRAAGNSRDEGCRDPEHAPLLPQPLAAQVQVSARRRRAGGAGDPGNVPHRAPGHRALLLIFLCFSNL